MDSRYTPNRLRSAWTKGGAVTLENPIPGLNHLRAFSSDELNDIVYSECDAASAGITPFEVFCVGWGGRRRWASAAEGLKVTRAMIALYEKWEAAEPVPGRGTPESIGTKLRVLRRLESILDQADARDIRFTIVVTHST